MISKELSIEDTLDPSSFPLFHSISATLTWWARRPFVLINAVLSRWERPLLFVLVVIGLAAEIQLHHAPSVRSFEMTVPWPVVRGQYTFRILNSITDFPVERRTGAREFAIYHREGIRSGRPRDRHIWAAIKYMEFPLVIIFLLLLFDLGEIFIFIPNHTKSSRTE